jgi:phosphoribosylamine--glycine ligase
MRRHGIPTADYAVFTDSDAAIEFARHADYPLVVKADGLAAGKGVLICASPSEAEAAIRLVLDERAFGAAGERIVIEEFLQGDELSVIALVDGERIAVLPPARDFKRLRDGNVGPNTGGMGCYSPVDDLSPGLLAVVRETILEPVVAGMRAEGRPYRGALYAGLMLTASGPSVLEFNCRLGDPETQVILPLLTGDFARALLDCAEGRFDPESIETSPGAAVCIVLAAEGYPEAPRRGDPILGLEEAGHDGALVFHAGTALRGGQLVTDGGRVLSIVATGFNVPEARESAYAAADHVSFRGMQMRRDIAPAPALVPA